MATPDPFNAAKVIEDALKASLYFNTLLREGHTADVAKTLTVAWIQSQAVERLKPNAPPDEGEEWRR